MDTTNTQAIIVRATNGLFTAMADVQNAKAIVDDLGASLTLTADIKAAGTALLTVLATFEQNRAALQKVRTP